ncbi:12462_t:CDS:1, partial [Racocetra fulgida]
LSSEKKNLLDGYGRKPEETLILSFEEKLMLSLEEQPLDKVIFKRDPFIKLLRFSLQIAIALLYDNPNVTESILTWIKDITKQFVPNGNKENTKTIYDLLIPRNQLEDKKENTTTSQLEDKKENEFEMAIRLYDDANYISEQKYKKDNKENNTIFVPYLKMKDYKDQIRQLRELAEHYENRCSEIMSFDRIDKQKIEELKDNLESQNDIIELHQFIKENKQRDADSAQSLKEETEKLVR